MTALAQSAVLPPSSSVAIEIDVTPTSTKTVTGALRDVGRSAGVGADPDADDKKVVNVLVRKEVGLRRLELTQTSTQLATQPQTVGELSQCFPCTHIPSALHSQRPPQSAPPFCGSQESLASSAQLPAPGH